MSYKSFGNTWWGQAWLNALLHIDYSNRLPRGVRYARNGSVKEIKITRKYISAKVSGTRRTPYSIKIEKEEFSEIEKQKIIEIISSNPFYLSQLASHKLPITLLEDLQK